MTETIATSELYCVECGYDLRRLESDRCPECGAVIDRSVSGQSVIPWRQRARIGRFLGFWKTVWMVMFRPHRLAAEMNRPANLEDALKFRRVVAILAMLVLVPSIPLGIIQSLDRRWYTPLFLWSDPLGSALNALAILCIWAGTWCFLMAATSVPSYFFHPRSLTVEQQNRAVALSYYACAPLAMMPVVVATSIATSGVFGILLGYRSPLYAQGIVLFLIFAPPLLVAFSIWRTPVRVLRAATRCGGERQIALSLSLPLLWAALAGLFLVVLPALVCFVVMMVISLW